MTMHHPYVMLRVDKVAANTIRLDGRSQMHAAVNHLQHMTHTHETSTWANSPLSYRESPDWAQLTVLLLAYALVGFVPL